MSSARNPTRGECSTSCRCFRQIAQLGHPVLRAPVAPVTFPASDAIRALVADMLATLRDANGVGIAAPQVFESVAIFIVASRPIPRYPDAPLMEPEVVINPEIIERSAEMVKDWEGCLSIPGLRGEVPATGTSRPGTRRSRARSLNGNFSDFVARIFQHEDDHLHGIVFLDRLESTRDRDHREGISKANGEVRDSPGVRGIAFPSETQG